MALGFRRPIGAAADVKELEYVSALHQTDLTQVREDGSIKDEDIVHFLKSRYGIEVTCEEVRSKVIRGLGGGDEDKDDCIDLMEIVCMLLIPTLRKASTTHDLPKEMVRPREGLVEYVLKMMLHDVTGDDKPKKLTMALVQRILISYGEYDLAANNDLLEEMIEAAESPDGTLDLDSFSRGLTHDIELYDVDNELRVSTNFDDVYAAHNRQVLGSDSGEDSDTTSLAKKEVTTCDNHDSDVIETQISPNTKSIDDAEEDVMLRASVSASTPGSQKENPMSEKGASDQIIDLEEAGMSCTSSSVAEGGKDLTRVHTAAAIDMVAGTYRSKVLIVFLWASFIFSFFAVRYRVNKQNTQKAASGSNFEYDDTRFVPSFFCESYQYGASWGAEADTMTCHASVSVIQWLAIFALASLYGLFFVGLGSIGNYVDCRRFYAPLIGASFATALVLVPALVVGNMQEPESSAEVEEYYAQIFALVLLAVVVLFHLFHSIAILMPQLSTSRHKLVQYIATGSLMGEVNVKQAASYKVVAMANNALKVSKNKNKDAVLETHYGQALLAFSKTENQYEEAGGLRWSWNAIFNGKASKQEGIWFSARLLASNMSQYAVGIFVLLYGLRLTIQVGQNYDVRHAKEQIGKYVQLFFNRTVDPDLLTELVANITVATVEFLTTSGALENRNCSSASEVSCLVDPTSVYDILSCNVTSTTDALCGFLNEERRGNLTDALRQLALLSAAGLDTKGFFQKAATMVESATERTVDSLYPSERYMVTIPFAVGTVFAFLTAITLAVTYVPSVTSTVLKLRSGVIPSLKDPEFNRYRVAADKVTILTGSLFWGCAIASILVGGILGFILFLFLWQVTISLVHRVVATLIGILVVVLLSLILVVPCRRTMYHGFYRTKPAAANVTALALETTNFALSVGFVLIRMVKLLIVSALYVGRIDTFYLAPGVGQIGKMELDTYPRIFLKSVLASEAHRHPYLELLGTIYLMKLRYGAHFGRRAGSTWRLIFVHVLMPWLSKYRILEDVQQVDRDDAESLKDADGVLQVIDLHHSYSRDPSQMRMLGTSARHRGSLRALQDNIAYELEKENIELRAEVEELKRRLLTTLDDADQVTGGNPSNTVGTDIETTVTHKT